MPLQSFELNEGSSQPVKQLIEKVENGGVQVYDRQGNLVAFVIAPNDPESLAYIDAYHDREAHRDEIAAARARRGGITTAALLERAEAARLQAEEREQRELLAKTAQESFDYYRMAMEARTTAEEL